MSRPALSVCIPNYNMAKWVAGAIDSALAQEPADLVEVVVMDNASTDNSRELLERYRGISRVHIELAEEHLPMADNWNRTVRAASGEWCVVLCADDELLPSLFTDLELWQWDGSVVAVGAAAEVCEGEEGRSVFTHGGVEPRVYEGESGLLDLLAGNPMCLSATAFRRTAFEEARGFRSTAGVLADWDLWVRLLARSGARVAITGRVGARYYRDRGSVWERLVDEGRDAAITGAWLRDLLPMLERRGIARAARRQFAGLAVRAAIGSTAGGEGAAARARLSAAVRYGSGLPRGRGAAEWVLVASGVGARLIRWRVSARPGIRIRRRVRGLWIRSRRCRWSG